MIMKCILFLCFFSIAGASWRWLLPQNNDKNYHQITTADCPNNVYHTDKLKETFELDFYRKIPFCYEKFQTYQRDHEKEEKYTLYEQHFDQQQPINQHSEDAFAFQPNNKQQAFSDPHMIDPGYFQHSRHFNKFENKKD